MKKICAAIAALFVLTAGSSWAQESTYYAAPTNGTGTNYELRLNAIEDQMRALTGKLEQLEYAVRRIDLALQRQQADSEQRLARLEATPVPVPAQTAAAQQPRAQSVSAATVAGGNAEEAEAETAGAESSVSGTLGDLKVRGEKITGAVKNPKSPPLPETPPDYGLTPQEQYDRAFGLLRQANYEDAEKAFKGFIDKNPKDHLVDNAKYWYAETFYVRAKFNDAAVAFADAFQQNPKGAKAPDSLLKMAMSLAAIEKTQDACTTLNELKKSYPNAPQTIRSRTDQERSRLKCGSTAPAKKQ